MLKCTKTIDEKSYANAEKMIIYSLVKIQEPNNTTGD
jgi:hypothetical protein